jgi:hypothetical protein
LIFGLGGGWWCWQQDATILTRFFLAVGCFLVKKMVKILSRNQTSYISNIIFEVFNQNKKKFTESQENVFDGRLAS